MYYPWNNVLSMKQCWQQPTLLSVSSSLWLRSLILAFSFRSFSVLSSSVCFISLFSSFIRRIWFWQIWFWKTCQHTQVRIHERAHTPAHTHTCMRTDTHTHTHMHAHRHTHTHTCAHIHTHTCMHTHTHACTHTSTRMHTHKHTDACMCTHTHTHTHTHSHTIWGLRTGGAKVDIAKKIKFDVLRNKYSLAVSLWLVSVPSFHYKILFTYRLWTSVDTSMAVLK